MIMNLQFLRLMVIGRITWEIMVNQESCFILKMKKMVKPAKNTPPIKAIQEMFWLMLLHCCLRSRPLKKSNIAKQRSHLSAIISIGETSPTEARATIVWPPHIIAAIKRATEGLAHKRRKSEIKNTINICHF